jgi:phenylacetate-CoA ligase
MNNFEAVYLKLPIAMQHLLCSVEGWRIQQSRFDKQFHILLNEAQSRTYWEQKQLHTYRDERVRQFVLHAAQTSPFYRRRFQELQINPEEIRGVNDLAVLPILTKREVQEHAAEIASESVRERDRRMTHTSGTTGSGLRFPTTRRATHEQWAVWWRYRHWHGLRQADWCGYFGGRSVVPIAQTKKPFWRYNYPGKQIIFSGYHLSPANLPAYIEELRRRQPVWLHGYPSLLTLLAAYLLETNETPGYRPRVITTGAENLLTQQADLLERVFGVRPRQHYGLAEAVANISECEAGRLHVDEDFAAVEFIKNPHGNGFKVIGTNFTNPAMPLLRYDTEDVVTLNNEPCVCGRAGRVVEKIDGRLEDYLVLKSGAYVGRLDHIFKDLIHIKEAQIVQQAVGQMRIRIVRGGGYSDEDQAALLAETRQRVGNDMEITLEYVEKLERTQTGKLRFVVSEIAKHQLQHISANSK